MEDIVRALSRELAILRGEVATLRLRQANMFRPGTVEDVKPGEYRARVRLADGDGEPFLSPWRPWSAMAGGNARDWTALEQGQQVLLLSPAGVLGQSLILPFGFSDAVPPPSSSADERVLGFGDCKITLRAEGMTAEGARHLLKGETRTDGKTLLGSPDATKRVLLEDGSPATKVFGV